MGDAGRRGLLDTPGLHYDPFRSRCLLSLFLPFALLQLSTPAYAASPSRVGKSLAKRYARRLGCDKSDVNVTAEPVPPLRTPPVTFHTFSIDACGQQLAASATIWIGFMTAWDDMTVRKRAPLEMDCSAEEIEFHVIDAKTRLAKGCGIQATYVFAGYDETGSWVANAMKE